MKKAPAVFGLSFSIPITATSCFLVRFYSFRSTVFDAVTFHISFCFLTTLKRGGQDFGADKRIRTSTELLRHGPEPCASASSAISA